MKHMKKYATLCALSTLLFSGCQKNDNEMAKEETFQYVTNHYNYQDKSFSLTYKVNARFEPISASGDVETYRAVFGDNQEQMPQAFLIENIDDQNLTYSIRAFDNSEAMDKYQERTQHIKIPQPEDERWWWCTTHSNSGSATFRFYRHTNFNDEITSISEVSRSYFQRSSLQHPSENDAISSFQLDGPASVDLFRHGCFGLNQIRFTESIANLHAIYIWSATDAEFTGEQFWWHPGTGTQTNANFGDETSSIKGWSL